MRNRIHIAIAEPSVIIRSGMVSVLKRLSDLNIDVFEICDIVTLSVQTAKYKPDILIVDPSYLGMFASQIKHDSECGNLKLIALQNAFTDKAALQHYDDILSLYDSAETIKDKLLGLINEDDPDDSRQELSTREREIVVCVVKGMTNKQMAESLCLSVHTIMTHRRNISNKLQIHSSAGLTIYAIVNRLVDINDIKNTITAEE